MICSAWQVFGIQKVKNIFKLKILNLTSLKFIVCLRATSNKYFDFLHHYTNLSFFPTLILQISVPCSDNFSKSASYLAKICLLKTLNMHMSIIQVMELTKTETKVQLAHLKKHENKFSKQLTFLNALSHSIRGSFSAILSVFYAYIFLQNKRSVQLVYLRSLKFMFSENVPANFTFTFIINTLFFKLSNNYNTNNSILHSRRGTKNTLNLEHKNLIQHGWSMMLGTYTVCLVYRPDILYCMYINKCQTNTVTSSPADRVSFLCGDSLRH